MFDIYLRNVKDKIYDFILNPFFKKLLKINVTPNMITVLGFILGLFSVYFCYLGGGKNENNNLNDEEFNYLFCAFLFWVLNRFVDGLDGIYARKTNQSSEFGGFLDITTDFVIYSLIPIFLVFNKNTDSVNWHLGLSLSLMLGAFFVNGACLFMLSAICEKKREEATTLAMPVSLIEGFEAVIFFSLMILFNNYLTIIFYTFAGLVGVNIIHRLYWARKMLSDKNK